MEQNKLNEIKTKMRIEKIKAFSPEEFERVFGNTVSKNVCLKGVEELISNGLTIESLYSERNMSSRKFQILNTESRDYKFFNFDFITKQLGKAFNSKSAELNYNLVYQCEMWLSNDDEAALEEIFELFNIDRPTDYKGRSLSVSDIVILGDIEYFTDSIGFVRLD